MIMHHQVSSHLHMIITAIDYIASLCLVIFGFQRYLSVQSQWCWGSILIISMAPALTAISTASAINDEDMRQDTLRKVRRTMYWLAFPVLSGLTLILSGCIVSAAQAPLLHELQYPIHAILGQVVLAILQRKDLVGRTERGRDDNEHGRDSPSTSSETLANHAADPRYALVDLDRDVINDYHGQLWDIHSQTLGS